MGIWRCKGCDTELTVAGSTYWKAMVLPLLPVIPMILFREELGKKALIVLVLCGGVDWAAGVEQTGAISS